MKTWRFRSFGFVLAVIIGGGVAGWILFPIFTAFGVGLAAAIAREPGIDPTTLALGYYRVHSVSHTQAIVGAILGSLAAMRGAWSKRSKKGNKGQTEGP